MKFNSTNWRTGVAQSVKCLATNWMTGRPRFNPRQRQEDFSSNLCIDWLWPTQPPVQLVPGVFSPGVKRVWGATLTIHPI
jgi:hypothetical protein